MRAVANGMKTTVLDAARTWAAGMGVTKHVTHWLCSWPLGSTAKLHRDGADAWHTIWRYLTWSFNALFDGRFPTRDFLGHLSTHPLAGDRVSNQSTRESAWCDPLPKICRPDSSNTVRVSNVVGTVLNNVGCAVTEMAGHVLRLPSKHSADEQVKTPSTVHCII